MQPGTEPIDSVSKIVQLTFWQIAFRDRYVYAVHFAFLALIALLWQFKGIGNPFGFGAMIGMILSRLGWTAFGVWARGRKTVLTKNLSPAIALGVPLGFAAVLLVLRICF